MRLDEIDIFSPDRYAREGYPHAEWARLRHEAPVLWYPTNEAFPFWAITRHEDIVSISRRPDRFLSAPHSIDIPAEASQRGYELPPTIISMDPPKHRIYRQIISRRFTPRSLRAIEPDIDRIGAGIVDELARDGLEGECDFVERVSMRLPIAVIAWMLGVRREDWKRLFDWTNRLAGPADPEYRVVGESPVETRARANQEVSEYFADLVEEKRRRPADDLVSALGAAEIGGRLLPEAELLAYLMLLVVGGNETTRNATTGGLLALIENPDQLDRLRRDPELLRPAIEEILRWTSPIVHMGRTAATDVEIRGERIRQGQMVALFYPSANRDESVFDEPERFRIDRRPNPHLSFGIGEHFCLGAHLARLELRVAFRHLVRRLRDAECSGPVERLRSAQVGGIKRLPIRYRLN